MAGLGLCCALCLLLATGLPASSSRSQEWYTAFVRTVYTDPGSNVTVVENTESGRYGDSSPKENVQGWVGIPRGHRLEGCSTDTEYYVPTPPGGAQSREPWIALVARGGCTFKEKVVNAARKMASAVVIYNEPKSGNATVPVSHIGTGNTVVIMVGHLKGLEILEPIQRDIPVKMVITVGTRHVQEFISNQSVVFVAIAFITMMIISLAWLIFYYIQRFLYTGSQFGNQSNRKKTKKAIGQLQLHTVKRNEKGLDVDAESCAVCIENYKPKDAVRILPCKHVFHRVCIDPWLLEHRTCPMCKLDVIKALGFWVDSEDVLEIPSHEPVVGNVPVGNLNIIQEDHRTEVNSLPSSSTSESVQQCSSPREYAGETTALLGSDGENRHEEHLSSY
uniref:E3 ubiquitin-protein ligase RNF149 n=1 Tax=Geotrypetes seraphini TaxID=260995 RepID=A0A6P8RGJ7_GEOSA|nr:E3 ubiquitin-protein ligase RNF149 [Geotrypetes seraphini]